MLRAVCSRRSEFIREKYEFKTYFGQPSAQPTSGAGATASTNDPYAGKTPQEIRRLQVLANCCWVVFSTTFAAIGGYESR